MSKIIIYQTSDNQTQIDVKFEQEAVWLTQSQLAKLFQRDRTVISKHSNNIYEKGELEVKSNVQKMHIENSDKPVTYYNLDIIISVGYRVKSQQVTLFHIWATQRLKEYLIKGFAIDRNRLENIGGGNYRKELLGTIRDIRSNEKV